MKEKLLNVVLVNLGPILLKLVSPEIIRKGFDAGLDAIEKAVIESENTVDNALVLPVLKTVRETLNIN